MNRPQNRVVEIEAGSSTPREIEEALKRTWAANPHVPQSVRTHLGIAAGEIGANIVEHAASARDARIWMDVCVLPSQVIVEIADDGDPVQIDMNGVRMPDGISERGRGLALAKAVLERLIYRREEKNHWVLISERFA